MALFPDSVPADTDPVKLGASVIRALKTALNTVFSPYLNDDGTFKNNVVTGAALVDATVAKAKLASDVYPVLQVPTGTVQMFAGSAAPTNYVLCDGANYDGASPTYAALFALIGTTYGNSGGAGHFNVPDLKGRVVVGLDGGASRTPTIAALGATDGAATVTLTAAQSGLPAHTHDMSPNYVSYSGGTQALGGGGAQGDGGNATGGVHGGAQPAAQAHQNLQPSIGLNYIIRL
jgi:microcystin-dependent protein